MPEQPSSPFSTSPRNDREPTAGAASTPSPARVHQVVSRAALAAGQPLFLELHDGSVLGLEPYPSDAPTALVRPDGSAIPARDVIRVTHSEDASGYRPHAVHSRPADRASITFDDDRCTFRMIGSEQTMVVPFRSFGINYDSPHAITWATAFCQGPNRTDDLFAGSGSPAVEAYVDIRTITGDFYSAHRAADGRVTIVDLRESVRSGVRVWAEVASLVLTPVNQLAITTTDDVPLFTDPVSELQINVGARPAHPLSVTCDTYVSDRPIGCSDWAAAQPAPPTVWDALAAGH